MLLLDLLGKICCNDPLFCRIASVPFLIIVKRYCTNQALLEYVERFAKVALKMLLGVESKARAGAQRANPGAGSKHNAVEAVAMRRTAIIETLAKLLHLRCAALNEGPCDALRRRWTV